jgi:hypothetical protein
MTANTTIATNNYVTGHIAVDISAVKGKHHTDDSTAPTPTTVVAPIPSATDNGNDSNASKVTTGNDATERKIHNDDLIPCEVTIRIKVFHGNHARGINSFSSLGVSHECLVGWRNGQTRK